MTQQLRKERVRPEPVLGLEGKGTKKVGSGSRSFAGDPGAVAIALGLLIAAVGSVDLVLAWIPLEVGNLEWEFGTVSRTFDGLPLATVGIAALLGGLVQRRARRGLLAFGVAMGAGALVLVGLSVFYALTIPAAMQAAPGPVREALIEASLRTGLFMVLYVAGYTWMCWYSLRTSRELRRRKDSR